MFFKIEKGCKLFDDFMNIINKILSVDEVALDLVKEFNGTELNGYIPVRSPFQIGGGVRAVVFDVNPGKDWKLLNKKKWNNIYCPNTRTTNGKNIQKRFDDLPYIKSDEINFLLKIVKDSNIGHPGWNIFDNVILIETHDYVNYDWYTPVDGMVEITTKEYKQIEETNGVLETN
jgi:hypothetical protein